MASNFGRGRFAEARSRVIIGPLPDDFLRLVPEQGVGVAGHHHGERQQLNWDGAHGQAQAAGVGCQLRGCLEVTLDQATLVKNYGITRMDPYCRVRIGRQARETPTHPNGGRTPVWNHRLSFDLNGGETALFVEVFDECRYRMEDQRIAWCKVRLPSALWEQEATIDDWYPLTGFKGKQGAMDGEGLIHLVLHFQPLTPNGSISASLSADSLSASLSSTTERGRPSRPACESAVQARQSGEREMRSHTAAELAANIRSLTEMFPAMGSDVLGSCHALA